MMQGWNYCSFQNMRVRTIIKIMKIIENFQINTIQTSFSLWNKIHVSSIEDKTAWMICIWFFNFMMGFGYYSYQFIYSIIIKKEIFTGSLSSFQMITEDRGVRGSGSADYRLNPNPTYLVRFFKFLTQLKFGLNFIGLGRLGFISVWVGLGWIE